MKRKNCMKRKYMFMALLCYALTTAAQDASHNYVRTRSMLDETGGKYLDKVEYFDGLGRPFQTVLKKVTASSSNLVTLQEYDVAGRAANSWLPIVSSAEYVAPASFKSSAPGNYGNDSRPYGQPVYEASPLNRTVKEYGPGAAWHGGHSVNTDYLANSTANAQLNCINYSVSSAGALTSNGSYASGQLSVVKTTDEDLNVSYTFTDKPATVTHTHTASGKTTRTEVHAYSYDHADRLLKVEHTLGGTNVPLAVYGYDNFGRLQSKSLHGSSTNKLTYAYNVRNWLTGISGTKFTQNLYYNTGNGTARYNGSISSMTWKAGNESTVRGYKFTYGGLDRLLNATYGETAGINANTDRFSENVTAYDKNGNIKTLQRYGQTGASTYGLIDNLTFTLGGNQLTRVDDAVATSAYNNGFEFKDGVKQANEYNYDSNGNLTKDLNKGITNISYNCLNLPSVVTFSDGSTITYTYAADGTKLKTVHKTGSTTTTTDYCGNVVYENGVQKLLLTDEGYVTLSDGKYHYYLKDHQGNNRVVINQSGTVEEANHYYPFGGVFASSGNVQPYKYNGKELDAKKGLNWYDYGARHYDAALGRFTTVDPSAENYYSTSPFTYCLNNPLNYIDPLGTDTVDVKDVDWNKFDPKKDVVALDEVAVSVPNALTKVGTRALEPISGFWGYVGYYLLDIGSTYHSEQTRFTYKVGTDGVITGVAPMVGTPPLPGFAKTSNLNTIRGLWSLTKQGSSKVMKHPIRGLFYKSKSDGLWWVKDQTKHGGSFYKVYKETNKGLEWHKDADKYGNFIINKHKSDVGIFIPWKELSK